MDYAELYQTLYTALLDFYTSKRQVDAMPLTGLEPASAMPVRLEIAARLYAGEILHSGLPWDCDAEDAHVDAALTMADRLIAAHNASLAKEGE